MDLRLTNEQAEWLKATLDVILDNNHWGRGNLGPDQKEHAETIYKKLVQKLQEGKW